jgi:predicted RND superfamily exporter protein
VVSLGLLGRIAPNETPTVELVVPPAVLAPVERVRALFGPSAESELVVVSGGGPLTDARINVIEDALAHVSGVTRVWSVRSRPRLATGEGGFVIAAGPPEATSSQPIDRFLRPSASDAGFWLVLDKSTIALTSARRFQRDLETTWARVRADGESARIVGNTATRVAGWEASAHDAQRLLPWLLVTVVAVPLLFFRSLVAVFFPLLIAGLTTGALFVAYRLVHGTVDAWALLIVPFVWSVATMDALHLYEGTSHRAASGAPRSLIVDEAVASARAEVSAPALVTAATTALSMLTLAFPGAPRLLRTLGVWAAVGTMLAYAFTFMFGGALLRVFHARPIPRWSGSAVRRIALFSRCHARAVVAAWLVVLAVSTVGLLQIHIEPSYRHTFAPGNRAGDALRDVERMLDADLLPIDIYLEARTPRQRHPAELALATLGLSDYLATLPETRLTLSAATLLSEWTITDPTARRRLADPRFLEQLHESLGPVVEDPQLAEWLRLDRGVTRTQVLFRPMSFARKEELVSWITRYVENNTLGYRVTFGGAGTFAHVIEREGKSGVLWGAVTDLGLLVVLMAIVLRRFRLVGIALAGNVAPVVALFGVMGAMGVPWSFDLIGLPMIVLGLAIDDTIHLLWPLRRGGTSAALHSSIRAYGTAVMATATLLAATLAGLSLSSFGANHEMGALLPIGLALGLAAELTLVPAAMALSRRGGK